MLLALVVVVSLSVRSVDAGRTVTTAVSDQDPVADADRPGDTAAASIPDSVPAADTVPLPAADDGGPPSAPVTLAFGGDVQFENWLATAVRTDPQGALAPLSRLLGDADLAMVNLETAVTSRGTPSPKPYTFRAPEQGLVALRSAGVDVVSIANNHGMDFGQTGLTDTLQAAGAAGLGIVGGGRDAADAYQPHVTEIHGRRIAVLGATQVLDKIATRDWTAQTGRPGLASAKTEGDGLPRLLTAVRAAASSADTVVVLLHWGREKASCPIPPQRQLAEQLRDAGADIVVGGHSHRLAGAGYSAGDTVVGYGLGNLVLPVTRGPATASGVLTVTIAPDDGTTMAWRPAELRDGVATAIDGADAHAATRAWEELRGCTALDASPS